jgi:hypothetical protein
MLDTVKLTKRESIKKWRMKLVIYYVEIQYVAYQFF